MTLRTSAIQLLVILFIAMIIFVYEDIPVWILTIISVPAILRFFKLKISNIFINIFMFAMLSLSFLSLGPSLNAEMALSFFMIITSCKILQCYNSRDFFITKLILLICLVGSGLFNATILMAIFMAISIILIISMIGLENIDQPLDSNLFKSLLNSLKAIALALPIATALFFFFPRFRSFVPTVGANLKGRIGHNKEVKNDQINELLTSSALAFRAHTSKKVAINKLYWRGRVLTRTDGYNWFPIQLKKQSSYVKKKKNESLFDYTVKLEKDLYGDLFTLDYPIFINSKEVNILNNDEYATYHFQGRKKIISYQAYSELNDNYKADNINLTPYLKLPRKLETKKLNNLISFTSNSSIKKIKRKFEVFFTKNNFLYSLAPGKMSDLDSFISNKKGYCTHYASFAAVILRASNIPARLVSGFQGGEYNPYSSHYIVRSNDAHTWVEIYLNDKWNRFDPTELIAPDRIRLGGQNFFAPYPFSFIFGDENKNWLLNTAIIKKYSQLKLYFDYLDMKFNQFLQDFNKAYQKELAKILGLKLYQFYLMAIWIPIIISFLYFIYGLINQEKKDLSLENKLYRQFKNKLQKLDILIPDYVSLENFHYYLDQELKNKEEFLKIIDCFIQIKYQNKKIDLKSLQSKIRSLHN